MLMNDIRRNNPYVSDIAVETVSLDATLVILVSMVVDTSFTTVEESVVLEDDVSAVLSTVEGVVGGVEVS